MTEDSTLNYDEMPRHVRKLFMLGMQLCIAMKELDQTKEETLTYVEECWVTMNLNEGNISGFLNSMMISDLKNLADEIEEKDD